VPLRVIAGGTRAYSHLCQLAARAEGVWRARRDQEEEEDAGQEEEEEEEEAVLAPQKECRSQRP
jgi:hypothetical protein